MKKQTREEKNKEIQLREKKHNLAMMLKAGTISEEYYQNKLKDLK